MAKDPKIYKCFKKPTIKQYATNNPTNRQGFDKS